MTPVEALALLDAAITVYQRAAAIVDEKRRAGEISAEEQASRLAKVHAVYARVGLPHPPADAGSVG